MRTYVIGKRNKSVSEIYRRHNIVDHLFPYNVNRREFTSRMALIVMLDKFNQVAGAKLKEDEKISYATMEEIMEYRKRIEINNDLYKELYDSSTTELLYIDVEDEEIQVYLCRNYITEINNLISQCKKMVVLQACCNYIERVPIGIGMLSQLKVLILSKNRLSYIPEEIGMCTELREINLSSNFLSDLPSSFMSLKKVHTLALVGNLFTNIPKHIGKMRSLRFLNVKGNKISFVPYEIFQLPFLLKLGISMEHLQYKKDSIETFNTLGLAELAARRIVDKLIMVSSSIPEHISRYLLKANECCFCGKTYIDSYVKIFSSHIFDGEVYPIRYNMCKKHYEKHSERLEMMFKLKMDKYRNPLKKHSATNMSVSEIFEPFCYSDSDFKELRETVKNPHQNKLPSKKYPLAFVLKNSESFQKRNAIMDNNTPQTDDLFGFRGYLP